MCFSRSRRPAAAPVDPISYKPSRPVSEADLAIFHMNRNKQRTANGVRSTIRNADNTPDKKADKKKEDNEGETLGYLGKKIKRKTPLMTGNKYPSFSNKNDISSLRKKTLG